MSDLLGIGASGVNAYRAALGVVADNVANADTVGYARRTVALKASPRAGAGNPLTRDIGNGSGVDAQATLRAYDALKAKAARNAGSDLARLATRSDWLTRLQSVIAGGSADLNARLGGFYDGAQQLAAAPTSVAARTIFLDRADQVAAGFRASAADLAELGDDLAHATTAATTEVNGLTAALAQVNTQLTRTQAGGEASNALLDERDRLLGQLGGFLQIGVTEGVGGTVTVRLGNGPNAAVLVTRDQATRVGVRDGANGAELVLDPTHEARAVRLPASGSLAGLIEAARQVGTAAAGIDGLATRFATAVNAAHELGVDAMGTDGKALFATQTLAITPGAANAGVATIEAVIADGAPLDPAGYMLRRDAGLWVLARADGSGAVSGAGALVLDGVTVTPSPGARDGDAFVLATTGGAAGLSLRPMMPQELAVSARWLVNAAPGNAGTAKLVPGSDPTVGLPALPAYVFRFVDASHVEVVDPATSLVIPTGPGFAFQFSGSAVAGDSFRVVRAGPGSGDNGNLNGVLATRAGAGVEDGLDASVAGIAGQVSETVRLTKAARAVYDDAAKASDAISGVDLDREAAELTRLQAAYKANAQVIATARDLFDALLAVVR
ncbi:flagellar hook-associated protein FlgK [Glacieibacterium sp.]|uniref:flagellar hook-associated protein FlgK n=1 Tax=Glacieibacterium sp. TaxID=2860237 RepID=UPI003B00AD3E